MHGGSQRQVLVLSGGSGYNSLVEATPNAIYVLPSVYCADSLGQWRCVAI